MSFLLAIASTIPVILAWLLISQVLGVAVFRLLGKGFPLNPWRHRQQYRTAMQTLSDLQYALWMGVFTWGWGVFLAIEVFDHIGRRYFDEPTRAHSTAALVFGLAIWSLAGLGFGYFQRKGFSEKVFGGRQKY